MHEIFQGNFRKPRIINQNEKTVKVFSEMGEKGFKGVAVVDDNGKLIANLSPSDLKGITIDSCDVLNTLVIEFLEQDNAHGWWSVPITFEPESTFFECLEQFVCSRVHRMYLVDSVGKPTGVLSHRDMLQKLFFIVK